MKRLVTLVIIAALLATPVAAQSLSILLPALTFPDPDPTTPTMDCLPSVVVVCPTGQ